ncbi:MAG: hypothetical protein JRM85_07655 [Nitrososphaerota archaeon]|nr:hypothetical protein [Nitrososphaerota archaeon]
MSVGDAVVRRSSVAPRVVGASAREPEGRKEVVDDGDPQPSSARSHRAPAQARDCSCSLHIAEAAVARTGAVSSEAPDGSRVRASPSSRDAARNLPI